MFNVTQTKAAAALAIAATIFVPAAYGQELTSPDALDRNRELAQARVAPKLQIVEVQSNGFDWGDAGIGAAGMLALLGMGTGTLAAGRRRRLITAS